MLNPAFWVQHWFNPSLEPGSTGTQCRSCFGWRDDPRHLYGTPPNLAACVVYGAAKPKHAGGRVAGRARAQREAQLAAQAPAALLSAAARERVRQLAEELKAQARTASPHLLGMPPEQELAVLTPEARSEVLALLF